MTAEDRDAWTLWQIRAIWRAVKHGEQLHADLERQITDLARRVEELEGKPDA